MYAHEPHHTPDDDGLEFVTEFLVYAKPDCSPSTMSKYRTHLRAFDSWLAENPPSIGAERRAPRLLHASTADVQNFLGHLHHRGGGLSASTRKSYLGSLRSFYGYCTRMRITTDDPSAAVKTPRVRHRPGLHLTAPEIQALLRVRTSARDRIQTYLMVFTAARASELLGLRWSDIDFVGRTMLLHGKGGKSRTIDIHPELMVELRRWYVEIERLAEHNPRIAAARIDPKRDFVLLTRNGRPLRHTTLYKQLKLRAAIAGIHVRDDTTGENRSRVSPHVLRRSFATILLNDGIPLDAVADVLGHASIDTTRAHYAFTSTARRRATIHAFDLRRTDDAAPYRHAA